MGTRGPAPKPSERRQRANRRDFGQLVPIRQETPDPPAGVLVPTKQAWLQFWGDDLSVLVKPSDMPALTRLFRYYDEWERAYRMTKKKGRLVAGSQGQPVLNPLYKEQLGAIEANISKLEDRFGLSPMARLKLGVTFGQAHQSLEELNKHMDQDVVEVIELEDEGS